MSRLQRLGIISPSNLGECPYASLIVLVAKKDGTLCICGDNRQLNQMTIKPAYTFPRIDEIYTSLPNAYCPVALAQLMGYNQIPVREEDRPKTAFITYKGLYVFIVMPFGLGNAPASFERLMDGIFRKGIGKDLSGLTRRSSDVDPTPYRDATHSRSHIGTTHRYRFEVQADEVTTVSRIHSLLGPCH